MYAGNMETKTIALDREAYDLLRQRKGKGESFSDAVKRLARRRRPLSSFAGIWTGMTKEERKRIGEALRRGRELDRARAAGLLDRWG